MRERQLKPNEVVWNNNKVENRSNNLALADKIIYHGHFWRSMVSARKLFSRKENHVRNINPTI